MVYNLLASPQEDNYSFPAYSFPAATDQTPYFEGLTSSISNAYFETENSNAGFPFETDQEGNSDYISFFNSDLASGDVYIS
ncbi:hypothetical protein TSUD_359590 [Trifolium subterraneum]|uniref:Uncharacterized protein n=1 Tax=Trifolium subterraneum TaxID=3900 RepID=A0A2Z6MQC6_TRISU|nr:hypothetical protein TSUD_359590 [Trifolium subterraneum]